LNTIKHSKKDRGHLFFYLHFRRYISLFPGIPPYRRLDFWKERLFLFLKLELQGFKTEKHVSFGI